MTYFVYLNGPPKSGKDTIANLLADKYENVVHVKFAQMLRNAVCGIFEINEESYEADKDETDVLQYFNCADWASLTYRQFVIRLSEKVLKPNFGKGYLGIALAESILANAIHQPRDTVYIISDLGFRHELVELRHRIDCWDEILIQLHREGLNFDNDSRNYVNDVIPLTKVSTNCSVERSVEYVGLLIKAMLLSRRDTLRLAK